MIKQIIHDIPEVHTQDLFVPQRFLGRLIGKNGDNIRNLQRLVVWGLLRGLLSNWMTVWSRTLSVSSHR